MDYIERSVGQRIAGSDDSREVTLIDGARQVGKTTLLKYLSDDSGRAYADLDDPDVRRLAQEDPAAFLAAYPPPVFIDELQNAPELVSAIAGQAMEDGTPDMFWIAGSRTSGPMQQLSEELGERLDAVHMRGLSQREKAGRPPERLSFDYESLLDRQRSLDGAWSMEDVPDHIWNGGLPAMQVAEGTREDLRALFAPYIETYILREVSELAGVRELRRFSRFLHACASRNSRPVNYSQLAAEADVSVPTARSWLEILKDLGILYLLMPFESSAFSRLVKTPKMYFTDTGLASYLSEWPSPESLMTDGFGPAFFENYVLMELISNLEAFDEPYALSWFRDSNGNEIDVILEREDGLYPLRISFNSAPVVPDGGSFAVLDRKGIARNAGGIVCLCAEPVRLNESDSLIPSFII